MLIPNLSRSSFSPYILIQTLGINLLAIHPHDLLKRLCIPFMTLLQSESLLDLNSNHHFTISARLRGHSEPTLRLPLSLGATTFNYENQLILFLLSLPQKEYPTNFLKSIDYSNWGNE